MADLDTLIDQVYSRYDPQYSSDELTESEKNEIRRKLDEILETLDDISFPDIADYKSQIRKIENLLTDAQDQIERLRDSL